MAAKPSVHKDVTCPFCAMLCDDLVVTDSRGGAFRVANNTCALAARGFGRRADTQSPSIRGRPVPLEEALDRAARILGEAQAPVIAGLGTDVAGSRSALALAERCGAVVDHMHGEAAMRNLRVLQSRGWILTTFGELKNRADTVLFVGTDVHSAYPRFFERLVWPVHSLRRGRGPAIMYLGSPRRVRPPGAPAGWKPLRVPCTDAELGELVAALRALLGGYIPPCKGPLTRNRLRNLGKIRDCLSGAGYAVIVWAAGALPGAHADLVIRELCEIVAALNRTTRAAGLPLGGDDGAASWINVCTWQSGFPSRVSFATGAPEYDPYLFSLPRMLAGGADALLWISCFDPERIPASFAMPTILVGRATARAARSAEVYLPAGVPGLDHGGNLFRMDSVVNVPLGHLRPSAHPPAHELLDRVREKLR